MPSSLLQRNSHRLWGTGLLLVELDGRGLGSWCLSDIGVQVNLAQ